MEPLTDQEIEHYWELHKRMHLEGRLERPDRKYCEYCKDVYPFPPREQENEHFRWVAGSKSHRCKKYNKQKHEECRYASRNTVTGYLKHKYKTLEERSSGKYVRSGRENQIGRLKISKEEFMKWGEESLPKFMKEKGIEVLYDGSGEIHIDRINNDLGYEPGNLQWLLRDEHWEKSVKIDEVYKNNEIKIKKWEIDRLRARS